MYKIVQTRRAALTIVSRSSFWDSLFDRLTTLSTALRGNSPSLVGPYITRLAWMSPFLGCGNKTLAQITPRLGVERTGRDHAVDNCTNN